MAEERGPGVKAAQAAWLAACAQAGCATSLPAEQVAIAEAVGRVTARPVHARWSVPAHPVAAMDGIAVHALDVGPDAGHPYRPVVLPPDRFDLIDTGDPLPAGRDTVVMREHVQRRLDGAVEILTPTAAGRHVRAVGEDVRAGEPLLSAHHLLRPVDVATAASAGHIELTVHARPLVAVIPTGDEIRPIGADLARGEVLETNSLLLTGILHDAGCDVRTWAIQPDQPSRIATAARDAATEADLVLIIAGSSAGRGDHTAAVLRTLGEVIVHGVAVKPGHPVVLGVLHTERPVPVIGVPGYPISAAMTVDLFALPMLAGLHNRRPPRRPTITARVAVDLAPADVERYLLVTVREPDRPDDPVPIADPSHRGAGALSALMRADGLLLIAAGRQHRAGDPVAIELLRHPDPTRAPGRSSSG
ncbi:MAG: molybdopterin molybdotransferase MoeA [Actinomycetota bacterium]|nr:molybdopterin molybdotransferase MoeA [Actinomycetota bacterium]